MVMGFVAGEHCTLEGPIAHVVTVLGLLSEMVLTRDSLLSASHVLG